MNLHYIDVGITACACSSVNILLLATKHWLHAMIEKGARKFWQLYDILRVRELNSKFKPTFISMKTSQLIIAYNNTYHEPPQRSPNLW